MSNIKIDNKSVELFENNNFEKIKIFFYGAWCSGTKLSISWNFEVDDSLVEIETDYKFKVYVEKKDIDKYENATITMVKVTDSNWHNKGNKYKFVYTSEKVVDRCGCWSSFSFWEKKKPKLDLNKLKDLKNKFKK